MPNLFGEVICFLVGNGGHGGSQVRRAREPAPVLFTMSTGTSSRMFLANQEEFKSFGPGRGRKNQRCGMDTKSMNQHVCIP